MADATLDLTGGGTLAQAISGAGTLEIGAAYKLGLSSLAIGAIDIVAGASLSGAGTLTGAMQDGGTLSAVSGTLMLAGALSGGGTLAAGAFGVLDLAQGATLNETISGAGKLQLGGAQSYTLASPAAVSIAHLAVMSGVTLSGSGTIASTVSDNGSITAAGGELTISGALNGTGFLAASAGATLDLSAGGTLNQAISGAGTLELSSAYVLGSKLPTVSAILVDAGASLSGTGSLAGTIDVLGTVQASAGTLSLAGTLSGGGTLSAAAGAVLAVTKGGAFAGDLAGAGTVKIAASTTLNAGASLSAAHILVTGNLTLGAGESVSNAAGDNFALSAASGVIITLAGSTGDTFTNAGTLAANGAGGEHVSAAFMNTGTAGVSAGTLAFLGAVTNNGSFSAAAGAAIFDKDVGGTGTLSIGATGTLSLLLGSAAGQTVDFLAGTGALDLTAPIDFLGAIGGFGGGDTIDLVNTVGTISVYSNGVLTISDGTRTEARLHFDGSYTKSEFSLASDGHGGMVLTFV